MPELEVKPTLKKRRYIYSSSSLLPFLPLDF
jgi:hypothetical protein